MDENKILWAVLSLALQHPVQAFVIFGARSFFAVGGGGHPVHCEVLSSIPALSISCINPFFVALFFLNFTF